MGRGKRKARPEVYRVLSYILRTRRHARGWCQLDLAVALGVSERQVKRLESGLHVPPHPRTYERLVRVPGFLVKATIRIRRVVPVSGVHFRHDAPLLKATSH